VINKIWLKIVLTALPVLALVSPLLAKAANDYLITASDTIPIFELGATAVKNNGLAVLTVAVPYLAGAAVAFIVVLIFWAVVHYFRSHA